MNTITLLLSIAAVVLSGGAMSVALSNKARLDAITATSNGPDVSPMGAGGSGHR